MVFGNKDYSMRVSVNPDQLALKGLTVSDVAQAIRERNGLYAAGQIGGKPNPNQLEFTFPVLAPGRLKTPEQFGDIILRADPDGSIVRLKDVGSVELGALGYSMIGQYAGKPSALVIVTLQPGANSLNTMKGVEAALKELKTAFPPGVRYELPVDTTKFIKVSIEEVAKTFGEAILLVLFVVLIFLGSWRAALIPLIAVPVAIVGTFTGLLVLGFSINTLTLFALVLAIGIVVDDAIVVVENVERIMHEEHLAPREATIKAMEQVTGPIIAIVLVLSSVYLPVAFLGGSTGVMYRQFGVTIAISRRNLRTGGVDAESRALPPSAEAEPQQDFHLPLVRQCVQRVREYVHPNRALDDQAGGDLHAALRRSDLDHRLAVPQHSHRVRAAGRPGLFHDGRQPATGRLVGPYQRGGPRD